jgi:fibronectin type 3 domain-containing protein
VQWPAVVGATSYNLYWSETTPVAIATAQVVKGAVSPYRHTGRTNGRLVYYAVTSVNADGESALSTEIGAMPVAPVPAPPGTLNATPGDRMVTIAWTAVSRADSYTLYWSNTAGFDTEDAGVTKVENIQATSYAHLSLTNGTAYYYLVTAVSTGGESVVSTQASATPLPPAPGAPANLTATPGDAHVHLSWSASLDATSYNVYWSNTAGIVVGAAGVTQIPGVTATSYEPTGLTNGDTYYYAVSSVGPVHCRTRFR